MPTRRHIITALAALGAAAAGGVAISFRSAMSMARAGIDPSLSRMAETRHGQLEFAETGQGQPFLMLHGTGGGFDQGLLMARPLLHHTLRIIAPSRFGYLRTPMPLGADHWAEADAMADLLDGLEIERAAVAGVSAGAIPALAFALRHPDRCAALFPIVPAFFLPGRPPVEPWSPLQERAVRAALRSDLLFWSAITFFPDKVTGSVLATDPALLRHADKAEAERATAVMRALLPISQRAEGLIYDGFQANRDLGLDLSGIRVPTLAISCADDRYRTAENARHIAATVPGARALVFPEGGHIWVGHDAEVAQAIATRLAETGFL